MSRRSLIPLTILVVGVAGGIAFAWTGPYQLTENGSSDVNVSACKEFMPGSVTCMVWQTDRNGNWDVFAKYCHIQNGNGWEAELPVCADSFDDVLPVVTMHSSWGEFICAWERRTSAVTGEIWTAFGYNQDSWETPWRIARTVHSAGDSSRPSIVAVRNEGGWDSTLVVWCEQDTGGSCIKYAVYDDFWWSEPAVAVAATGSVRRARLGRRGEYTKHPLLVWEQEGDVLYSELLEGAWTAPEEVAAHAAYDGNPDVISSGYSYSGGWGTWIVWESHRDGDTAVFITANDTFSIARRLCDSTQAGRNTSPCGTEIAFTMDFGSLVSAWVSDRSGNPDIYSVLSSSGDWRVDTSQAKDIGPVIASIDNNGKQIGWVLWQSDREGNWDIYGSFLYNSGTDDRAAGEESEGERPLPAVAAGTLLLPRRTDAILVDITGRKVMPLQPGANDIRHLAPGVYFVITPSPYPSPPEGERMKERGMRSAVSGERSAVSVRKVVIQR